MRQTKATWSKLHCICLPMPVWWLMEPWHIYAPQWGLVQERHRCCSANLVVPLKDVSLARLELLACLLATRLLCFVKSKFKEKIDEEYLLSDSKIASALLDNWRCKQMEAVCLEQSSRNPEEHQATGVETMCRKKKSCQPHHQRFRCLKLLENEGWWQGLLWLIETSLSGHPSRAWKHCA